MTSNSSRTGSRRPPAEHRSRATPFRSGRQGFDSRPGLQLDLDSNASCSIDNVNNENIYWPTGQAPTGDFLVKVHMYKSPCSESGPASASGTLTLAYCGADSPRTVPFSLSGTDDAVEVKFTSKCTSRVSGTVRYEDFPVTDTGLGAGALVPSRFVKVLAVRAADDAMLAEGSTDAAGKYDLSFVNDKTPGFYVMVAAQRDSRGFKQKVQDLDGNLWAFRSPKKTEAPLDETKPPADGKGFKLDLDLKAVDGAGALNIFDVGLTSALHAFGQTGKAPPELTFRWSFGVAPGGEVVSYFAKPGTITVNGDSVDPDEYDDVVIAHEYGHFVLSSFSKDESGGGSHSSNNRSGPTLAWSEGWATFFACSSQKRSSYADTNTGGMGVFYSLETLPATKPLGNANGTLEGDLSEALVASVLLDLADSTNEDKDTLTMRSAIWSVVTDYLKDGSTKLADRGIAGRDLVDFLDGWVCMGFGETGDDDAKGLRGIVKGLAGLSYDFKAVASCK